jgi:hypothetical protein
MQHGRGHQLHSPFYANRTHCMLALCSVRAAEQKAWIPDARRVQKSRRIDANTDLGAAGMFDHLARST